MHWNNLDSGKLPMWVEARPSPLPPDARSPRQSQRISSQGAGTDLLRRSQCEASRHQN
jgi:hypothetical protein